MKHILIRTDNALKFEEISEMLALYGCKGVQAPYGAEPGLAPDGARFAAIIREATTLTELPGGRVEHESALSVLLDGSDTPVVYTERARGHMEPEPPSPTPGAYDWDDRFVPAGSTMTLHELKSRGLKVSARQRAVGSWLQAWLHYQEPVAWRHMEPSSSVASWLAAQPLLNHPATAATHAVIDRVGKSGAWFKASANRRAKHYWWPGLNSGIPMSPKKDYVHELTFLVHDLIHWAMPDVLPESGSERDHRLYVATRMMSEAITLVMADMAFIGQALEAGLEYDVGKRKIHPAFNPAHPIRDWCQAMSHYAIRGDDSRVARLAMSPSALADFKDKYSPFFEEDLRWTAHNARHLATHVDPRWKEQLRAFASRHPQLRLTTTEAYADAFGADDEAMVDAIFERLWSIHWSWLGARPDASAAQGLALSGEAVAVEADEELSPGALRLLRWWLGQMALTWKMDDLPLSGCVRGAIERACLESPTEASLSALLPLWRNYVDALEGLSRLSANDNALYQAYYPALPPLFVSYDMDKGSYAGIAEAWRQGRAP